MRVAYQLRDLVVNYGKTRVLNIETLAVAAGRITALVGPNGAGKSTLLQVLAFLRPASTGSQEFFGSPVYSGDLPSLCREVALVQQNPYLLRGTVRENIELGLRLRRMSAHHRSQRVEHILQLLSLNALAGRSINTLSGGEVQKTAIARALVLQPRVLLLDEPFTHLDRGFHLRLENLLRDLPSSHQCTIVFSSPDLLRARIVADDIFSLVNGNTVHSSSANLYHGRIDTHSGCFDTGRIKILLAGPHSRETHLAIEPAHIILSRSALDSSIRNSYRGRISALAEEKDQVRVTVEAGETFEVLITRAALRQQGFELGGELWLSFKSSSVQLF